MGKRLFLVIPCLCVVIYLIHSLVKPISEVFQLNQYPSLVSPNGIPYFETSQHPSSEHAHHHPTNTVTILSVPSWTNSTLLDLSEWLSLMAEIQWPQPTQVLTTADQATDPSQCACSVVDPKETYQVGESVTLTVIAKDMRGLPKTYGGDFFQAKLYNTELKASVYGQVTDNNNGTYTINLALRWAGMATVSVRMIHSSEAVQVLARQRDQDPDKVYFLGFFKSEGQVETVQCNAQESSRLLGDGTNCCCRFTDHLTEETWVCRKPSKLPCSAWVEHSFGGYQARLSSLESNLLSRSSTDIALKCKNVFNVQQQTQETSKRGKCLHGQHTPVPAGFYLQDNWISLMCDTQSFPSPQHISTCLKDKHILMMGDSTLRQWFDYLLQTVPTLKKLNFFTSQKSGPFEAVDVAANIRLEWRAHGLPLRTDKTPRADLHYIASELERLPGGEHTVVVFTIWAHFTTYPLGTYVRRLATIRQAVLSLLQRSLGRTLVVIKSANTGYKDVYGSDWLSWQLDCVLRAMFRNIPVVILDVWQMTSCHYAPDNIHPPLVVVRNEVELFLSFVCPK